jgi:hypothetical protein
MSDKRAYGNKSRDISTYIDRHIKRKIILLVDLLLMRKDGENRKRIEEEATGAYQ